LTEVGVVSNACGNAFPVLAPLVAVNASIIVFVVEVGKELQKRFFLWHLAGNNLGVHVAGVVALHESSLDGVAIISDKLIESVVNHSLALSRNH
jgi:hypothetical protein